MEADGVCGCGIRLMANFQVVKLAGAAGIYLD
jgi:hypothetical protein